MMKYTNHVNIYKIKTALKVPLMYNPDNFALTEKNPYIIIIGDEVLIQDNSINYETDNISEGFSLTIFKRTFIEQNTDIFEKII